MITMNSSLATKSCTATTCGRRREASSALLGRIVAGIDVGARVRELLDRHLAVQRDRRPPTTTLAALADHAAHLVARSTLPSAAASDLSTRTPPPLLHAPRPTTIEVPVDTVTPLCEPRRLRPAPGPGCVVEAPAPAGIGPISSRCRPLRNRLSVPGGPSGRHACSTQSACGAARQARLCCTRWWFKPRHPDLR